MRDVFVYIGAVIKRTFTGVFLFLDIAGVLALIIPFFKQDFPLWVSFGLISISLMMSTYFVWKEEKDKNKKLRKRIRRLKETIQKYEISIKGSKPCFDIDNTIAAAKLDIRNAKKEMEENNCLLGPGVIQVGFESDEEEITRLEKYLKSLLDYKKWIGNVYVLDLSITAKRFDENVIITISTNEGCIYVDDDYLTDNIPVTYAPNETPTFDVVSNGSKDKHNYSIEENGAIMIKLDKINPDIAVGVPSEKMYIHSDLSEVSLKIEISSKALRKPQAFEKKIILKDN